MKSKIPQTVTIPLTLANQAAILDSRAVQRHNAPARFNQPPRFSSLEATRQTSRRISLSGGVFVSAFPCFLSMVRQGKGALCPLVSCCQSANLALVLPPAFSSAWRRLTTDTKENIMNILHSSARPAIQTEGAK